MSAADVSSQPSSTSRLSPPLVWQAFDLGTSCCRSTARTALCSDARTRSFSRIAFSGCPAHGLRRARWSRFGM